MYEVGNFSFEGEVNIFFDNFLEPGLQITKYHTTVVSCPSHVQNWLIMTEKVQNLGLTEIIWLVTFNRTAPGMRWGQSPIKLLKSGVLKVTLTVGCR